MNAEIVSRTIQLILAPVVMITACGIILGGLLSRYAAINDRMRLMVHERLDQLVQLKSNPDDAFASTRLTHLDAQMPDLLRRHKLEHEAVLMTYCAILIFILSAMLLGLAAETNEAWAATIAFLVFALGTISLAISIILTIEEVRTSRRSITYEVQQIFELKAESSTRISK